MNGPVYTVRPCSAGASLSFIEAGRKRQRFPPGLTALGSVTRRAGPSRAECNADHTPGEAAAGDVPSTIRSSFCAAFRRISRAGRYSSDPLPAPGLLNSGKLDHDQPGRVPSPLHDFRRLTTDQDATPITLEGRGQETTVRRETLRILPDYVSNHISSHTVALPPILERPDIPCQRKPSPLDMVNSGYNTYTSDFNPVTPAHPTSVPLGNMCC